MRLPFVTGMRWPSILNANRLCFKVSDTHYAATWLLHPDAPKVTWEDARHARDINTGGNASMSANDQIVLEVKHLSKYFYGRKKKR